MQPELRTPRLRLRPATGAHTDALWALWTGPAVRRFLFDDAVITVERAAELVASMRMLAADGLGLWAIEPASDGAAGATAEPLLGCVALAPVGDDAEHLPALAGQVEFLIALRPDAWGRGLAAGARGAVLGWAVADPERAAVVAVVDVPNEASQRLVERLGFEMVAEGTGPRLPMRGYRLARERFDAGLVATAAAAR